MLGKDEVQKVLDKFAKKVISKAKRNLSKKNASNKLSKSLDYDLKVHTNSFSLDFLMEKYGKYQDRGVDGKKKKWGATDYDGRKLAFRNKRPPSRVFDKWMIRRGIAPRTKEGKFMSRKSLSFLIARSIYNNGIKPSLFFTKPYEKEFKALPDFLIEAYGLEVDEFLEQTFKV